jgi:hypothetical protein
MGASSKLRTLRKSINLPSSYQRGNSEKIGFRKWIEHQFLPKIHGQAPHSLKFFLQVSPVLAASPENIKGDTHNR